VSDAPSSPPLRLRLDELRGQEAARATLSTLARGGAEPPPLLLFGPEGVGKRTAALMLAASLVCERAEEGVACGTCRPCGRVAAAASTPLPFDPARDSPTVHPDVGVVSVAPGRARIAIGQARDVTASMASPPFELARRVYVIDGAERATLSALNALLKVLEEPPAWGQLVLVTPTPWALPMTVRSRLRALRFAALDPATIEALLAEEGYPADDARRRAQAARGSVARARTVDPDAERDRSQTWARIIARLDDGEPAGPLAVAAGEAFGASGDDARAALETLLEVVRDALAAERGLAPSAGPVRDALEPQHQAAVARLCAPPLDGVQVADRMLVELDRFNRNPRLAVEGAVLALAGLVR
jgi:DNA polymerase-3 subunit delta'